MIETAMVMAAGHGTRMAPLTDDRSKAMVEVGGRTLIDHMLDRLHDAGVRRAIVNVHAHADQLEDHLQRRETGPEIIVSCERDGLLETGGGVVKALPLLGKDPVLICNIDAVWIEFTPVIQALWDAWDPEEMDDLLLLAPKPRTLGYPGLGDFDMDRDGRLSWKAGEKAFWIYAGVEIFTPARAVSFPPEKFSRTRIWQKSIDRGRVFGLPIPGYWMHVGDPATRDAAEAILSGEVDVPV
ncbi:MAG: nucleotidyltransferase family protein [Pseudomonadota bacterium]